MSAERIYQRLPRQLQTVAMNAHALRIERHRYGRRVRRKTAELSETARAERRQLEEIQDRHIRRVVRTAYHRSPYYRDLMDRLGIDANRVRGRQDLHWFPVLTRDDLRRNVDRIFTSPKPRRNWLHGHTSGTTGSPLSLWYDRDLCVMTNAVDARQKLWGGKTANDWIGLLLGRVIVPVQQYRPPFWRTNYIQRQVWFSAFHMSEDHLPLYVSEIRKRGLRFLEGYPSTLYVLAKYLLRGGERLPLNATFTSSETLHPQQRKAIEAAFECKLFDFYGLAERVIFAAECESHRHKHLAEEYGYTEVVDGDGNAVQPGETGSLVGTSLHNTAMPLIRYRTSDLSCLVTDQCECGRTLICMRDVTTKAEDLVITPSGRVISPSVLTHPFKPFPQIIESQVIQETLHSVLVKLVPSADFTETQQDQLVAGLSERLGEEVEVTVEIVGEIRREKSGKFRWVISRVDSPLKLSWAPETEPCFLPQPDLKGS